MNKSAFITLRNIKLREIELKKEQVYCTRHEWYETLECNLLRCFHEGRHITKEEIENQDNKMEAYFKSFGELYLLEQQYKLWCERYAYIYEEK